MLLLPEDGLLSQRLSGKEEKFRTKKIEDERLKKVHVIGEDYRDNRKEDWGINEFTCEHVMLEKEKKIRRYHIERMKKLKQRIKTRDRREVKTVQEQIRKLCELEDQNMDEIEKENDEI